MSKKVTMQDIANTLGISVNAVSLALNDKEGVSHTLRIEILETAIKMQYPIKKLNTKATLKNKTIVVMIEHQKKNDTHYYLRILDSIRHQAAIFKYRIVVEYYDITNLIIPKHISEHHTAGVIILGKIKEEMLTLLKSYIHEIICVNHSIPHLPIDTIVTNNFLGGYIACQYLINQGHTEIGFVGEINLSKNFKQRFQGYRQCMIHHFQLEDHMPLCLTKEIEDAVLQNDYSYIQKILLSHHEMPEAFVCVNDRNAAVVIKALQSNGYQIPKDIKVVGFDNTEISENMKPTLTSLEVRGEIIAKKTIRRMHEMIRDETIPETIMLTPQIIERQSTKR